MEIPGIGIVTKGRGGYYARMPVSVLGGKKCRIVIEGYDEDLNKDEFHAAIANFLSLDESVLREAERYVYMYYKDCTQDMEPGNHQNVYIASPSDVWAHVQFGDEPLIVRNDSGDNAIYISLECNCDWEDEHGLQIVFRNGLKITKVGEYDGHLTHSDAFDDEDLDDVVYRSWHEI